MRAVAVLVVIFATAATFGIIRDANRPTIEERLGRIGMLGEHPLHKIDPESNHTGKLHGSFILATGSISGEASTETCYKFFWGRNPQEVIPTSLPCSIFRFVIDDTKKTPTVEFIFRDDWLDHKWWGSAGEVENCNRWLSEDMVHFNKLSAAIIRMPRQLLKKEICELPD